MKAVRWHTDVKWVVLYIERWLKAPVFMPDGSLIHPQKGTPQGGVASPLLANLFLHYAFDKWMERENPTIHFERYADAAACHCRSQSQAEELKEKLKKRMNEVGLELHPEKTRIVYCKDDKKKEEYPKCNFDFLGYTFKPRKAGNRKGQFFISFLPAVSNKALKAMGQAIRKWRIHRRTGFDIEGLAGRINPVATGWFNYYGSYYRSALYVIANRLDRYLVRWAMRKYKKLRGRRRRAWIWLEGVKSREPMLFAHWRLLGTMAGR